MEFSDKSSDLNLELAFVAMGTYTSFSPEGKRIYKFMIKNNTISPLGGAGGTRNN